MSAEPKKKITRVRGRTRRAHSRINMTKLSKCPNCGHLKPPHIACPECGFYGNKKILITKTDKRIAQKLKEEKKTTSKPKQTPKPTKKTKNKKPSDSSTSSPASGQENKQDKK